ncbi:MAG: hypothetical protein IKH34_00635 [Oscillospiraceae bacterium]|nr:hypothetical protein [Oscillospiraceae bacterium]
MKELWCRCATDCNSPYSPVCALGTSPEGGSKAASWLPLRGSCRASAANETEGVISSFLHFFISSFLHFFISSFLHFFISSFLHFFISSFLHFFISSFLHCFISSFLHFFISSFLHFFILSAAGVGGVLIVKVKDVSV